MLPKRQQINERKGRTSFELPFCNNVLYTAEDIFKVLYWKTKADHKRKCLQNKPLLCYYD